MSAWSKFLVVMMLFFCAGTLQAQDHPADAKHDDGHKMINSNDLKWMDGPPGLPKGAKLAVLSGDPSKEGPFAVRLMFPANFEIKPHWHPTIENVSVLKGNLFMGTGETFDKNKSSAINEGGFAVMPAKMVHYAFTRGPVTIQLHGMGPFQITYVNDSDDPRNAKK